MEHETCSEAAISITFTTHIGSHMAPGSAHDRGSTEEVSGRGKTRSPCAAHDAARGSSCERLLESSVSQRPRRASRRDLLQQAT